MDFRFFDEVDEEQVHRLNLSCFGWSLDGKRIKKIRKLDANCSDWFSMYAVEKDEVMAQVGGTYPKIETTEGTMTVGYVWGVATLPSCARQGISTKLMNRLQEQMVSDGADLFLLGTGKSLVAHSMYLKLGYLDIYPFEWSIRRKLDWEDSGIAVVERRVKVQDGDCLFKEASKGYLGFVHRPKGYIKGRAAWGDRPFSSAFSFLRNDEPVGYALLSENELGPYIREFFCPDMKDFDDCFKALENKEKGEFIAHSIQTRPDIHGAFEKLGFEGQASHGTVMVRLPKKKASVKGIKNLLGIDTGKYQATTLDTY